MSCSCCGEDKTTVALPSRDDVALCRDCLGWLIGKIGVTSTPTLPVVDMAEAVAFYERAGFAVRIYSDDSGNAGDGFAFVDIDGQRVFDLDGAPDMDPNLNRAGCYLIAPDADAWHTRLQAAGVTVTAIADQPWGMREFELTDPSGNHVRIGHPGPGRVARTASPRADPSRPARSPRPHRTVPDVVPHPALPGRQWCRQDRRADRVPPRRHRPARVLRRHRRMGLAQRPQRRLIFLSDLPRMPEPMPRALAPDIDRALMAAVARLEDPFARCGLTVLRATGMRAGELLDLETDCVVDFGTHGTWLRVPLGKLGTERMVPLDPEPLALLDAWITNRGQQRSLPHRRDGRLADFVFVERGRRIGAHRPRTGLQAAAKAAELQDRAGNPLHVTLHQLRHTFGTTLVNAGMNLPALMALLGHVTPEMTLRYARLASPTIRDAYETAMTKVNGRRSLFTIPAGTSRAIPSKIDWLHSEMLKTRVAHGFCSRDPIAGACPYANICEQCNNFVPDPDQTDLLAAQRDDINVLRDDAVQRGWTDEAARHHRVADALDTHLRRIERAASANQCG